MNLKNCGASWAPPGLCPRPTGDSQHPLPSPENPACFSKTVMPKFRPDTSFICICHSCCIYGFIFQFENDFLQVKPARYHCLHKKTVLTKTSIYINFMSSTIACLYKSFSLINSSVQIQLKLQILRNSSTIFRSSYLDHSILQGVRPPMKK